MKSRFMRSAFALACTLAVTISAILPAAAYHDGEPWEGYHPVAHEAFKKTHARTDQPVIDGVKRTWIWGPQPYTEGMLEPYYDSPGGMRLVQYFDKSRMEINTPSGDQSSSWYVTNGLLVIDMIEGRYQIGDDAFDYSPDPADVAIAGDQDGATDITYAAIGELGLRSKPALSTGTTITQTIENGNVVHKGGYAQYGVTAAHRVQVDGIDHTVASVFWNFMNSEGIVYENHIAVVDKLFLNPFYATGYPITEAYWVEVNVAGSPQDVLWQCFERRCLTYTPDNETGWQVEAGNVGQHYFRWRYGVDGPDMVTASVGLVKIGDAGVMGSKFGCDDSLILFDREIQAFAQTEHRVRAALQQLLVAEEAGLYNVFAGKNLIVEQVTISGNTATVYLVGSLSLGGECDDPRVLETIRAMVVQSAPGITTVTIRLNGEIWTGSLQ
jgi:hypothetical protein